MLYVILLIAAIWAFIAVAATANTLSTPHLPAAGQLSLPAKLPEVSVIIAARDEQDRIEECVRRLLAQEGVDLQLIVVDDRSADRTPEILARLAGEFEGLRVVRVEALPAGWLGKCHACWVAATQARAPWLLFTDADIHMQPDVIRRAIAVAERDGAGHLTLWPGINCSGPLAQGVMLAFAQCLSLYAMPSRINRDRGRRGLGVGAFNLLRREVYETFGGHQALAMEVVDDAKLGLLVRKNGFRQRVYSGSEELDCNWALTVRGIIRATDKNWFAGMHYNTALTIAVIVGISAIWFGALLAPLVDTRWGWIGPAALALPIIPGAIQARNSKWPLYCAVFVPFGFLMMAVAAANSMWKTLRQGGVRWRDTFYPLAELRAGVVR